MIKYIIEVKNSSCWLKSKLIIIYTNFQKNVAYNALKWDGYVCGNGLQVVDGEGNYLLNDAYTPELVKKIHKIVKSENHIKVLRFLEKNNGVYSPDLEAFLDISNSILKTLEKHQYIIFKEEKIERNPFANNNNPSCCAYYQQRKLYANTVNNPQTIYASQTATSNNFNSSRPLIASDAVDVPLADREVNEIRHLIPFKDLIALTSNSEYKINGSDGIFQANPMPVAVIQSCYGSSHVQPIVSL